jgi:hypothetical protein
MDHQELGSFLRSRREVMQPADVGLPAGGRRRTPGLRVEEVARLAGLSVSYYRLCERGRGIHPSEQTVGCLARALRLTVDERDHLFRLAGYQPPLVFSNNGYADPALMYLLDALEGTPAVITDSLGYVITQNQPSRSLLGDWSGRTGKELNVVWRWFTDPSFRAILASEDHQDHANAYVANLRAAIEIHGGCPAVADLVDDLVAHSTEFAQLWDTVAPSLLRSNRKTIIHPAVGRLAVQCDVVRSSLTDHVLVLFRSRPGDDTAERLAFLNVLGTQEFG